jgi:SSS family solute:Na+ symporter
MEAVVWTDVVQSVVMVVGIAFCAISLSRDVLVGPKPLIQTAIDTGKFSLGTWDLSLSSRTIWVMIIYGLTENLRNLMADQNYVQKYSSVATDQQARRSIWMAMLIYIPLTAVFLYIGTALFAFYQGSDELALAGITKGDEVFPYFIATRLPVGLKGLVIAAVIAAAMSTLDSALNCSATVMLLDFCKRYFRPTLGDKASVLFLRVATAAWGLVGTGFALLMIRAQSALDVWWQISGIFGGGILGLFILSLLHVRLKMWQGLIAVAVSIAVICWGTFAHNLPDGWRWAQCNLDGIIIGAVGTAALMAVALVFGLANRVANQDSKIKGQNAK